MKKKIVYVIIGLTQGGAETMLYKLCKGMDKSKYNISVISLMGRGVFADKLEECGVKVYTLDLNILNTLIVLYKYIKLIKKIKPNVIHSWMYHANVVTLLCKPFYKKAKYISSIRVGLENYQGHKSLTKVLIKLNAKLSKYSDITLNNSKKSLNDHEAIGYKKQMFIANGFESNIYKPNNEIKNEFHKQYGLSKDILIIGIIVRNHPDKNIDLFLKLANQLIKNNTNLRFLIAGKGCTSLDIESYLDNKDDISNFFVFESVDSSQYLPLLDLYLSTSKVEGFPNVLAESMLCEVPVVTSDVGDCQLIVAEYGEVFDINESLEQIMERVLRALKSGSNVKQSMREYISDNFSIDEIVNVHEELYK